MAGALRQPATVNGSPETIIDDAVTAGAWAFGVVIVGKILDAVDGKATATQIAQAINGAIDVHDVAVAARSIRPMFRRAVFLGVLDAAWEADHDEAIRPVALSARDLVWAVLVEYVGKIMVSGRHRTREAADADAATRNAASAVDRKRFPAEDWPTFHVVYFPKGAPPNGTHLPRSFVPKGAVAESEAVGVGVRATIPGVEASPGFASMGVEAAAQHLESAQVLTKRAFDALDDRAKRRAFTVSNMSSKRMLDTTRRELVRQIRQGSDLRSFRDFAEKRLILRGWTPANPSHVETVFRTTVNQAYSAGRIAHMSQPHIVKARPLWQWLSVNDSRARATHKAAHRKLVRADDPIWQKVTPPASWNCRCRVVSRPASYGTPVPGSELNDLIEPGFTSGTAGLL